jgi:hypothetical protein
MIINYRRLTAAMTDLQPDMKVAGRHFSDNPRESAANGMVEGNPDDGTDNGSRPQG